jgi:hypothetical protein
MAYRLWIPVVMRFRPNRYYHPIQLAVRLSILVLQTSCITNPCRFDKGESVWQDADGDGYPSNNSFWPPYNSEWAASHIDSKWSCEAGDDYIPARTDDEWDCDDADPDVHPGAAEICGDGIYSSCHDDEYTYDCAVAYIGCYDDDWGITLSQALDYVSDGGAIEICGGYDLSSDDEDTSRNEVISRNIDIVGTESASFYSNTESATGSLTIDEGASVTITGFVFDRVALTVKDGAHATLSDVSWTGEYFAEGDYEPWSDTPLLVDEGSRADLNDCEFNGLNVYYSTVEVFRSEASFTRTTWTSNDSENYEWGSSIAISDGHVELEDSELEGPSGSAQCVMLYMNDTSASTLTIDDRTSFKYCDCDITAEGRSEPVCFDHTTGASMNCETQEWEAACE